VQALAEAKAAAVTRKMEKSMMLQFDNAEDVVRLSECLVG
jgi:hypothetical protein